MTLLMASTSTAFLLLLLLVVCCCLWLCDAANLMESSNIIIIYNKYIFHEDNIVYCRRLYIYIALLPTEMVNVCEFSPDNRCATTAR